MYSLNLVHCPFKYMMPVWQPHIYNISHADNLVILILTLFETVLYSNHNIYGNRWFIFLLSNVIVKALYLLIFTEVCSSFSLPQYSTIYLAWWPGSFVFGPMRLIIISGIILWPIEISHFFIIQKFKIWRFE